MQPVPGQKLEKPLRRGQEPQQRRMEGAPGPPIPPPLHPSLPTLLLVPHFRQPLLLEEIPCRREVHSQMRRGARKNQSGGERRCQPAPPRPVRRSRLHLLLLQLLHLRRHPGKPGRG